MFLFDQQLFFGAIKNSIKYLPVTIIISFVPILINFVLGTALAFDEYCGSRRARRIRNFFTLYAKSVPAILTLFLFYYLIYDLVAYLNKNCGFPIGVKDISVLWVAVIALAFDGIGMYAETMRGAFLSVGRGQMEAGYSIGMDERQIFNRVLFPQIMVEAIINLRMNILSSILFSSMVYSIGVMDMFNGSTEYAIRFYAYKEAYLGCALVYWALCAVVSRVILMVEKKIKKDNGVIIVQKG